MKKKDVYYFEKLGDDFDGFMSAYDVSRRVQLIFKQLLPKTSLADNPGILEIGCGTGRISSHLREASDNFTVNDISQKFTARVAKQFQCHAWAGDIVKLTGRGEEFDLIVSSECIEHTPDPYAALANMRRLLKKDGWIVITTPNKIWYPVLTVAHLLKIRKFDGMEVWTWPSQTKRWLKEQGFKKIYFSGCHLFPWQIPFVKKILPFFDQYGHRLYPIMINYGFSAQKG
ncbi:MAG: class I SAM-dependent methyltransferase [Candidatus Omnitrophica bacterium]|nr:class I SAM-dependent methyltransferase [Candidatus Omnitrophota bacterium]